MSPINSLFTSRCIRLLLIVIVGAIMGRACTNAVGEMAEQVRHGSDARATQIEQRVAGATS